MGDRNHGKKAREIARQIIFWALILWPPIHIVASRALGFSTWRFFGWGMYATPDPESLSALSLFWLSERLTTSEYRHLYHEFRAGRAEPLTAQCLNVLVTERRQRPIEISTEHVCGNKEVAFHAFAFKQLGSFGHLAALVDKTGVSLDLAPNRAAVIVFTRQRLDLSGHRAYTENNFFEVTGREVRYLGRFD